MISSTKVVDIVPVQNGINDYCMSSDKNYIVNDGKQAYNCLMEDTIFVKGKASLTITKEEVRKNVDWLYIQDPEFTYIISIP